MIDFTIVANIKQLKDRFLDGVHGQNIHQIFAFNDNPIYATRRAEVTRVHLIDIISHDDLMLQVNKYYTSLQNVDIYIKLRGRQKVYLDHKDTV